jgi:tetrahydromethanopterin S-methyltransferase subunit G
LVDFFMTSADLSLILRRLDEVERKLDRVLEELQTLNTPTAIGYSARRGSRPRKD